MTTAGGGDSGRSLSSGAQLIDHLPLAKTEAMQAFIELAGNLYQYGTLGRTRQKEENMLCDCQYEHGVDRLSSACGHDSDCINRLTQVECLEAECRCRSHCQNQRFQRRQYANIDIVLTEHKGFGLRAASDLQPDSFIYEYVGEVVNQPSFLKRMREYAEEGIKHFYFMMLQKEEYIDATKKGGIGRFANHSCNPNCYVAKWVVGPRIRMGIFAKRRIIRGEELTFNYNVDRYGHDAQMCYCGESNCVGFIGGKTQTDISTMDDLYLDALGITDDVEKLSLKGTKKKKGKKLDEDFVPVMKPIDENEVPKVVAAVRQASNRRIIHKLLTRIRMTDAEIVQRRLMRMHGYSIMGGILDDYKDDLEIVTLALESMSLWPLKSRNKVEDAKVEEPVSRYIAHQDEKAQSLSKELLSKWASLESTYRIPRRALRTDGEDQSGDVVVESFVLARKSDLDSPRPTKRLRLDFTDIPASTISIQPLGFKSALLNGSPARAPSMSAKPKSVVTLAQPPLPEAIRSELAAIIAQAAASAPNAEKEQPHLPASLPQKLRRHSSRPKEHSKMRTHDATTKDKRLSKLVSEIVVSCMSKYLGKHSVKLGHEEFKSHAKELTQSIADKEKKSKSYQDAKLDRLSEEKKEKMKIFVKAYMAKILRKRKGRTSSTIALPSHSSGTPDDQLDDDSPAPIDLPTPIVPNQADGLLSGDQFVGQEDDLYPSSDEDQFDGQDPCTTDSLSPAV